MDITQPRRMDAEALVRRTFNCDLYPRRNRMYANERNQIPSLSPQDPLLESVSHFCTWKKLGGNTSDEPVLPDRQRALIIQTVTRPKPPPPPQTSFLIIYISGIHFNNSRHGTKIRDVGSWQLDLRDMPRLVVEALHGAVSQTLATKQRQNLRRASAAVSPIITPVEGLLVDLTGSQCALLCLG